MSEPAATGPPTPPPHYGYDPISEAVGELKADVVWPALVTFIVWRLERPGGGYSDGHGVIIACNAREDEDMFGSMFLEHSCRTDGKQRVYGNDIRFFPDYVPFTDTARLDALKARIMKALDG